MNHTNQMGPASQELVVSNWFYRQQTHYIGEKAVTFLCHDIGLSEEFFAVVEIGGGDKVNDVIQLHPMVGKAMIRTDLRQYQGVRMLLLFLRNQ